VSRWPTVPLGELCSVTAGGTPARAVSSYYGGSIPWVKIGDMLQGEVSETEETITQAGLENSTAKLLPAGTVLISIFATIGRTAILGVDATSNQAIAGLTPYDPEILLPMYLRRYLDSTVEQLTSQARGVAQVNINSKILKEIEVPLPPPNAQRSVLEILDRADELRAKRQQAIALLDDLAQSIFLDMFGNLPSVFEAIPVGDLATNIRTGPFGSDLLHSEFVDDGIAVLGIDNAVNNEFAWSRRRFITNEKYQKLVRYRVYAGDLLITIMGTCGRCAIVPDDIPVAINTKHLCCITLDKSRCLPEFLHAYFLMHPTARRYLQRTAKGAIMSGLNATIIKSLPVQLPPFADQERFAKTSLQLREQKDQCKSQAQEFYELFKSLQQRAFRNEL
jgi:type I restriction enzyme S subunit